MRASTIVLFLAALMGQCLSGGVAAKSTDVEQAEVVVLTTEFVLPGRLDALVSDAERHGIAAEWHHVERSDPALLAADVASARLVVLHAPRGNDLARINEAVMPLLQRAGSDWLRVGTGGTAARGVTSDTASLLADYYQHPAPQNRDNFWRLLAVELHGRGDGPTAEPVRFPEAGILHPAHERLVFPHPTAYVEWLAERDQPLEQARAVIGIVGSSSMVEADYLGLLEALVERIEQAGGLPWVFYHPWQQKDGITEMVTLDDGPAVDVVINLGHIMGVSHRQAELDALNVPLVQGFNYRTGNAEDWRDDPNGLPMRVLPSFVAIPEQMGAQDPHVIAALENGVLEPMEEQLDVMVRRATRIAHLRRTPPGQQRLGLMFWSYPPGERGVLASNLNLPRSLEALLPALKAAGYRAEPLKADLLEQALPDLLDPWTGREDLDAFVERHPDRVLWLPLAEYKAWLESLPDPVRQRLIEHNGPPEAHRMVTDSPNGSRAFALPMLAAGELIMMPQPPRSMDGGNYHDSENPVHHGYLAAYLALREAVGIDALIHFGTHGSQEFLPGKQRGLHVHDDAMLVLDDLPVIYPYISDNIAEGLQAKRRGRAVTVTHQTPPFSPAGLVDELLELHDLLHDWEMVDEGPVRARLEQQVRERVIDQHFHDDLGWTETAIAEDFVGFERELHDYLHQIAADNQPLGLHSFGQAPSDEHRLLTVMQILGNELYEVLDIEEPGELFTGEFGPVEETPPYRFLARFLLEGESPADINGQQRAMVDEALELDELLRAGGEIPGLLRALQGGYLPTSPGGDPIRNRDLLPTGRNLFGFDPARMPTATAWEVGQELANDLLATHYQEHGRWPQRIALALWSSEAMRHQGAMEAKALYLLGLEPVWDEGGRVVGLDIIPADQLDRPRVDVVFSATGVYRDQFPQFVDHLAGAMPRLAELDEAGNPIAEQSQMMTQALIERGLDRDQALAMSSLRVFSNTMGDYGTGLTDTTLDAEFWDEEEQLADIFLTRMNTAYGAEGMPVEASFNGYDLFAEQLASVEAAVLSRSSNLHGLLSTDHPFEYLGGLSLAVRRLSGQSPALYVGNLRDPSASGQLMPASQFLSSELRSRYHHRQWLSAMQAEGYAGTLELLNVVNNSFGWQVMDPTMLRPDQWQAFHEIYVEDALGLGLDEWFREHNPNALARITERLLELVWRDYWEPADETLESLLETYQDLMEHGGAGQRASEEIADLARGFGLDGLAPQTVAGQQLAAIPTAEPVMPTFNLPLFLLLILLPLLLGGAVQWLRH
ncbi:cobaltochelatase subunit CobN [Wenzhouxiangella sp. AB-CW3]|uniref:cobaltochelatase subunit CobN n=1 Tax=Wenzhouxiangella sp. AB-CW3 TaxID=2771012 RepID=UPI00168BE6DE|nr:cobaltochelatase subunit CobN [Wenzhouxiangella sp. AB-CW3]QOC21471.1 cobaltochelatase subunit CobN [Wenzhouxiangella sp. AB-CW3]